MIKSDRPKIGLGTAAIGRPQYINIRQEESSNFSLEAFREKGWQVLESAYHQGVRYFDTAPGYGLAEQLLIDWVIEKKDPQIEIATKWGYTYTANFDSNATQHEVKEHSLHKLNEQWEQSKKLLPYLSTYQIHSATFDTGVLENEAVLNRLAELKAEHGLIIGITVSGENQTEVLRRGMAVEVNGEILFDAFQVTYNILDQSLTDIVDEMHHANKRIIVKEAMANGRVFPNSKYGHYAELYAVLKLISKKYGVGIDAIALRFCMESISPFVVLSGAANPAHVSENLQAHNLIFETEYLEKLKIFKTTPSAYWAERKKLRWN